MTTDVKENTTSLEFLDFEIKCESAKEDCEREVEWLWVDISNNRERYICDHHKIMWDQGQKYLFELFYEMKWIKL